MIDLPYQQPGRSCPVYESLSFSLRLCAGLSLSGGWPGRPQRCNRSERCSRSKRSSWPCRRSCYYYSRYGYNWGTGYRCRSCQFRYIPERSFNFTIPQGSSASQNLDRFLTTNTPAQPIRTGEALSFFTNPLSLGDSVTHDPPSSNIVIQKPGVYLVSFHGTVGLPSTSSGPVPSLIYLTQDGKNVDGASVETSLNQGGSYTSVAFSIPIQINSVPSVLQVVSQQGNLVFSNISFSVVQLGDNPPA